MLKPIIKARTNKSSNIVAFCWVWHQISISSFKWFWSDFYDSNTTIFIIAIWQLFAGLHPPLFCTTSVFLCWNADLSAQVAGQVWEGHGPLQGRTRADPPVLPISSNTLVKLNGGKYWHSHANTLTHTQLQPPLPSGCFPAPCSSKKTLTEAKFSGDTWSASHCAGFVCVVFGRRVANHKLSDDFHSQTCYWHQDDPSWALMACQHGDSRAAWSSTCQVLQRLSAGAPCHRRGASEGPRVAGWLACFSWQPCEEELLSEVEN